MFDPMIIFIFFLLGLCIGSFLNVVIYRLPIHMSIAKGRSICPSCRHSLSGADLVPLFSWLFLKAKCRYCGKPISARYPIVELLTGVLYALAGSVYGISWYGVIILVFISTLIVMAGIDIDTMEIPERLQIILAVCAVLSIFTGPEVAWTMRLYGALGLGLGMFLLSVFTGGGIGGADIELMAIAGLMFGLDIAFASFLMSYLLCFICLLPAIMKKKFDRGSEIPMIPYFGAVLIVMSLYGHSVLNWIYNLYTIV